MTYRIALTPTAQEMLRAITDRHARATIVARIDSLARDPEKQGKSLTGLLRGYRSLRAVGQRYRILYRVDRGTIVVVVVAVGLRKEGDRHDIYALAQKLIRSGLLKPPHT